MRSALYLILPCRLYGTKISLTKLERTITMLYLFDRAYFCDSVNFLGIPNYILSDIFNKSFCSVFDFYALSSLSLDLTVQAVVRCKRIIWHVWLIWILQCFIIFMTASPECEEVRCASWFVGFARRYWVMGVVVALCWTRRRHDVSRLTEILESLIEACLDITIEELAPLSLQLSCGTSSCPFLLHCDWLGSHNDVW